MKYVRQKTNYDCAVASLAMVSNRSYDYVRKELSKYRNRKFGEKFYGTEFFDIIKFLSKNNIKHKILFDKINPDRLKNNALISIRADSTMQTMYHAVAWDSNSKKIHDPYICKYDACEGFRKNIHFIIEIIS